MFCRHRISIFCSEECRYLLGGTVHGMNRAQTVARAMKPVVVKPSLIMSYLIKKQ